MSEKKEKEGQNLSKLKIKERKPIQKKIALKCILCKGSGKKNELKTCVSCKFYFHINCLEENYQGKKYVCDRCRIDKLYETKASKKQKRVE